MSDTVANDVYTILSNYTKPKGAKILEETKLNDVKIDSLDIVDILFALEEHFDIVIPTPTKDTAFDTAGDIAKQVQDILDWD